MKYIAKSTLLLIISLFIAPKSVADEGMWLLPLLKKQNYEKMVAMGLKLNPEDIYSPMSQGTVMHAVIHFGGGCTGVVVSSKGLVLTNHHCGYRQIQSHTTLEHNYLKEGFVARTLQEELPNIGLTVTFTESIHDVSEYVATYLEQHNESNPLNYMRRDYLQEIAKRWYHEHMGEETQGLKLDLAPFFEGNKFILYVQKVYSDVRLVAAPPSFIGSFGSDTDNWTWPRHSGDFSVFRIYTAPDGSPAPFSAENIPLAPDHYLPLEPAGVQEGEFVMIMGFPGTTHHFYTADEVVERRDVDNQIRIDMREARQTVLYELMQADEAIKIQYAAKYQGSTNAYKNAIGTNWAINKMNFVEAKKEEMEQLRHFAVTNDHPEYLQAIEEISRLVKERKQLRILQKLLDEALWRSVEVVKSPILSKDEFKKITNSESDIEGWLLTKFDSYFNRDYNHAVDKKVAKKMIASFVDAKPQTELFSQLGNIDDYVDHLFDTSLYLNREKLKAVLIKKDYDTYSNDPIVLLAKSIRAEMERTDKALEGFNRPFAEARKLYVQGIIQMKGEINLWPDANSTLRYTFGKVKGYQPRDNVFYGHQTTLEGVMEKQDPNSAEYYILPKMQEIYDRAEFGRLTLPNGQMPVNFCATTHTTGGNSGSPVINGEGKLVGLNFDRNWEGVGGDIIYLPNYQRSIICDGRYIALILGQYLEADNLIEEMGLN